MSYSSIKSFAFLFPILLFLSCGKKEAKEVKIPEGILNEETFTKVLTSFALAESAANMNIKSVNLQKVDSAYAFNPLAENNVTQAQYDSAVSFYVRQPELYKKIYENVLVALTEMQVKRNPLAKDTAVK